MQRGIAPERPFKAMLRAVEDAQLEGRIGSVEDGLELVRSEFERTNCSPRKTHILTDKKRSDACLTRSYPFIRLNPG